MQLLSEYTMQCLELYRDHTAHLATPAALCLTFSATLS